MNLSSLFGLMRQILGSLGQILLQPLRHWTKPDNHAPIPNAALDLARSKSELMLENALLRQQLIVLQRQTKRPKLSWRDRALFVLLASKLRTWKQSLLIVRPDTVLRWHRELFRRIWRRKSRSESKPGSVNNGIIVYQKHRDCVIDVCMGQAHRAYVGTSRLRSDSQNVPRSQFPGKRLLWLRALASLDINDTPPYLECMIEAQAATA